MPAGDEIFFSPKQQRKLKWIYGSLERAFSAFECFAYKQEERHETLGESLDPNNVAKVFYGMSLK